MNVRLLIVDDEPLARLRLRTLADAMESPAAQVLGEAADAPEALAWLQRDTADALLLDIGMPGRSGLELAAALKGMASPPAVIFVTAHAEHALQAFDLEAVDYLTKPVRLERLQAALQRVAQRLRPPLQAAGEAPVIVVSDRGRVLRLPLAEVLYLKARLKYVTLRTVSHSYVIDDALADLETRLGPGFIRVHRNALVARHAVRALSYRSEEPGEEGWAVRVAPADEWLAVSRRQLAAVREALVR